MGLENDELKMNSKQTFQNNLKLLKEQKISHICALNRIAGLKVLCRIFNQSILKTGDNSTLANGHYCVELSLKDIYEQMSKQTQKKYHQYQKGIASVNTGLLRHDIRMLIISGVIKKVDFKELPSYEQVEIVSEQRSFFDGTITNNPYINTTFYEVLDLRKSHLERLSKIKNQKILSYEVVQQLFGDQIANDCFNTTVRNYRTGLNTSNKNSFKYIIETIQKNKVVSIEDLSKYYSHKFSLMNGDYKSWKWWYFQLLRFDFSQYSITTCPDSELNQEDRLDILGTWVFFYDKKGCVLNEWISNKSSSKRK